MADTLPPALRDGPDAPFADIDEIVAELSEHRPVILVERRDKAVAGMLVAPAQSAGPDQINFMARHCRGLVILALTAERVAALHLPPMVENNNALYQQGFTTSIEARTGVSTGISAADRARTIHVAIDTGCGADDIVTPGHVFPVTARHGGVLARPGFTEASLDLMERAGCQNAAVLCAILDVDGGLAGPDALAGFARQHGLRIGSIAELVECRLHDEDLLEPMGRRRFTSRRGGEWDLHGFRNRIDGMAQFALVKGGVNPEAAARVPDAVPIRVHALSMLDDLLEQQGPCAGQLANAMDAMGHLDRAAILLVRQEEQLFPFDPATARPAAYPTPQISRALLAAKIIAQLGLGTVILDGDHDRALIDTLRSSGIKISADSCDDS